MSAILKINQADNVAVAVSDVAAGDVCYVDGRQLTATADVPAGHKVTLKNFIKGENVIKYGYPIGHTIKPMAQGSWISEREIETNLSGLLEYSYQPTTVLLDIPQENKTFKSRISV